MHSIAWQKWYALHCDELMIRCVTYCVRYLTSIWHLNTRRQLRLRPFWARARDVLKCTNRFTYLFFYFSVMLLSYANNTLKLTLCLLFNSAVTCIFNFACLFIFTYFVCLWHPRQRLEFFDNSFAPTISPETWTLCIKMLGKKFKGSGRWCK